MKDNRTTFEMLKNISMLTQVGLIIAVPLVLCIFLASYLQTRFSLGSWVSVVGIILGAGGAVDGVYRFFRSAAKQAKKTEKPRTGYNER